MNKITTGSLDRPKQHQPPDQDRVAKYDADGLDSGAPGADVLARISHTTDGLCDTIEAAIQDLQRVKMPITASRIHKCTGPSVTLDEIRKYAAQRFADPKE